MRREARDRRGGRGGAIRASAALLVALALAGCGRLGGPDEPAAPQSPTPPTSAPTTVGAPDPAGSPGTAMPGEDGPQPPVAAADVQELQHALDDATGLADQVEQDIASDG